MCLHIKCVRLYIRREWENSALIIDAKRRRRSSELLPRRSAAVGGGEHRHTSRLCVAFTHFTLCRLGEAASRYISTKAAPSFAHLHLKSELHTVKVREPPELFSRRSKQTNQAKVHKKLADLIRRARNILFAQAVYIVGMRIHSVNGERCFATSGGNCCVCLLSGTQQTVCFCCSNTNKRK